VGNIYLPTITKTYNLYLIHTSRKILPTMKKIICLMGSTASGKTQLAVQLVQQFPLEIISVDSAMVYRGLDIGTAKPDAETLKLAPHRLIDIADPAEPYSAGQFRIDALREIEDVLARGKTPLLVGGTMLYFRVLQQGLAKLPPANQVLREQIRHRGEQEGWAALHAELAKIDNAAASRINPQDTQRIQRALEVYQLTGTPISNWQASDTAPLANYQIQNIGLMPSDRALLHARIEQRFDAMLAAGFEEEVKKLFHRTDMHIDLPSMRSVGYRQMWRYLADEITQAEMREQAIAATRQLAKRQMTWLRSWPEVTLFDNRSVEMDWQQIAVQMLI
jgi:tRNA dimethylallyltransferase